MTDKQTNVSFDTNDIERTYTSTDDFERSYEPRLDVWYEFEVKTAIRQAAKGGYLQISCMVSALDAQGDSMFNKFINAPLPVKFKGVSPPEGAASILRGFLSTMYAEILPYDAVKKNPANEKKRDYYKNGVKLDKAAFEAGDATQVAIIKDKVDQLTDPGTADEALLELVGKRFYAKVTADKTGKYFNVKPMTAILTEGETVVYDPKVAFGRE